MRTKTMTFAEFQHAMITHAKELMGDNYDSDKGIDAYYLQDCWRENYDDGRTPEESVESDMSYWEA